MENLFKKIRMLFLSETDQAEIAKTLNGLGLGESEVEERYIWLGDKLMLVNTVQVDPNKFLQIIESQNLTTIIAEQGRGDDTYIPYALYACINNKLKLYVLSGATELQYRKEKPDPNEELLAKLHERGFSYRTKTSKPGWFIYHKTEESG